MKDMSEIRFQGKVQRGQGRGKDLGYPTANIKLEQHIPEGIYISTICIKGQTYNALTFIGTAKTFEENDYKAEVYILDFKEDIYDELVTVNLLQKIRENKKFETIDALVEQIKLDDKKARKYFNK